jgi:hypothetical protein
MSGGYDGWLKVWRLRSGHCPAGFRLESNYFFFNLFLNIFSNLAILG